VFWEKSTKKISKWKRESIRWKKRNRVRQTVLLKVLITAVPEVQDDDRRCETSWETWGSYCVVCVGITILIAMISWNAAAIGVINTPDAATVETVEPESSSWDMFTSVANENVWIIANAITQQGNERDLLRNEPTQFTPPDETKTWYPTTRWRKYLYSITATTDKVLINSTVTGVCNVHTDNSDKNGITTVSLYEVTEPINTTSKNTVTRNKLTTKKC
jgi:hypothetical protein